MKKFMIIGAAALMLVSGVAAIAAQPVSESPARTTEASAKTDYVDCKFNCRDFTGLDVSGIVKVTLAKSDFYKVKVTLPEEETEAAPEAPKTLHVASNSSFAPIGDYLSAQTEEAIALPFSKVEELTGKPLCKSAYKYASYWYPAQDRPLSNTIYNAGYDVDRVDLAAGIVYLTKAA